ncbi:MAG TPA: DUF1990 family protein [Ktedonobacterales bacterium]|nr:DUF1990 family protein [Ktedonobacterales bacterium]
MSETPPETPSPRRDDAANWAQSNTLLRVTEAREGAVNLNVNGRQVVGPLQGFGQLWLKTFRVTLAGVAATPAEVVTVWKSHLPSFQPPQNRFFPSLAGVAPGEIVLINATLSGMPVDTGVLVLYADDTSFTLMTPQGHPESGWVTFNADDEAGAVICRVQTLSRANDPIYEMGFRMLGTKAQDAIWQHVLTSLARYYGAETPVETKHECVDANVQWRYVTNVWENAAIRSQVYRLTTPLRWMRRAPRPANTPITPDDEVRE